MEHAASCPLAPFVVGMISSGATVVGRFWKGLFLSRGLAFLVFFVFLSCFGRAEEIPFEKGDIIGFWPSRSDHMKIKSAKVLEIKGRWVLVEAKGGGSEWNCWYNLDNFQSVWIEQKAKPGNQK